MDGNGKKRKPPSSTSSGTGTRASGGDEAATSTDSMPWLTWSESLESLLNDPRGEELFEEYLDEEGLSVQLNFFYAVQGLKLTAPEDEDHAISQKIRSVVELSKGLIGVSSATLDCLRVSYERCTKQGTFDVTIFDNAVQEVESHMASNLYPNFFQSEIYINELNNLTSPSVRSAATDNLQTVQEDLELTVKTKQERHGLSSRKAKALQKRNWGRNEHQFVEDSIKSGIPGNPYHAAYNPCLYVSRQDSETQSMSSGANTEHRFHISSRTAHSSSHHLSSRGKQTSSTSKHRQPQPIPDQDGQCQLAQITMDRAKSSFNNGEAAEKYPDKFATDLKRRLQEVFDLEARGEERFKVPKYVQFRSPPMRFDGQPSNPGRQGLAVKQHQMNPHPNDIVDALRKVHLRDSREDADDIIDAHCSRVFPDKTPDGRPSPPHQSKQYQGGRKQGHHSKKTEDLAIGYPSHHPHTPGYQDMSGGPIAGITSTRLIRRQQRSEVIDSGISVVTSSTAPLSRISSIAVPGPLPVDPTWKVGRSGGNGNGSGKTSAIILYEDDPREILKLSVSKLTLGVLKEHLPRKGPFRYFFKRHSASPEGSFVEIKGDDEVLPLFEGKLVVTLKCM